MGFDTIFLCVVLCCLRVDFPMDSLLVAKVKMSTCHCRMLIKSLSPIHINGIILIFPPAVRRIHHRRQVYTSDISRIFRFKFRNTQHISNIETDSCTYSIDKTRIVYSCCSHINEQPHKYGWNMNFIRYDYFFIFTVILFYIFFGSFSQSLTFTPS